MNQDLSCTRRVFLTGPAVAAGLTNSPLLATSSSTEINRESSEKANRKPIIISSANGFHAVKLAMQKISENGDDPLDAVIAGVNLVEEDPNDLSVGFGGLPNEQGDVELDAAVMHGPTHRAGAVAALRGIKYPSRIAKLVMSRSDHVLLVGQGALDFAQAHGFREESLLTDRARRVWLHWKETLSNRDDWLSPADNQVAADIRQYATQRETGTIHMSAMDQNGDLASVTTTSGMAFKIPGRVGDSPIIGAGLYVDNEVGAAGSTGRGEANLTNLSCYQVVENMRNGMSPVNACLDACKRIAEHTREPRLLTNGNPNFNVLFYALNKAGQYGGAGLKRGAQFVVHNGQQPRLINCAYLYE